MHNCKLERTVDFAGKETFSQYKFAYNWSFIFYYMFSIQNIKKEKNHFITLKPLFLQDLPFTIYEVWEVFLGL